MNTFKRVAITGLSVILLCMTSQQIYAQNEDTFVRESMVSKKDAIILSAIFPGLGQMTQGDKAKGVTYFLAEAASMIVFLNSHENFNTKEKTYEKDLKSFYNSALNEGEIYGRYDDALIQYKDLKDRKDDLDNLNTIRNSALVVAAAVYALNIVDAVLFSKSTVESKKAGIENDGVLISSSMIGKNPAIMFSKRF